MQAQLIVIGNELLNGKITDKNTHIFSKFCHENNIDLHAVHLIKDEEKSFINALNTIGKSSELILITGGLGPTRDDLTKKMLASFYQKEINFSQTALELVKKQYSDKNREFNQAISDYQNIPDDFEVLFNPLGYAPGLFLNNDKQIVIATPGVPYEFEEMLNQTIKKKIITPKTFKKHIIIKTARVPEAQIFQKIDPTLWDKLESLGNISSLPHPFGVDIGVEIKNKENEQKIIDIINNSPIKEYIWNIGPESIEEVIISTAKEKNLTFGFAESCTGGLCASRITDIAGCSSVFWGSIISYANEVKSKSLKVSEDTLKEFGAVSIQTATEMAQGAREELGVDIVITTTGIAGPGGASPKKPVGTVGIGVSTKKESTAQIYNFHGKRIDLKYRFSQVALFTLLDEIKRF